MDVDLIFKIAAIGIIVAVLNQLLIRSGREEQAMLTTLAGLIVVLSMIVGEISDLFRTVKSVLVCSAMSMVAVIGITVVAAFLAVLLRRYHPEYSMAIGLITGILVLALLLTQVAPVVGRLQTLLDSSSLPSEYGLILFKALGVCLLTQLAADACRDAGENAMAEKAELAGKVFLLLLALPLFEKIAELAVQLINGE